MESFSKAQRASINKPADSQIAEFASGLNAAEPGTCVKNSTEHGSKTNGERELCEAAPQVEIIPPILAAALVEPPQPGDIVCDESHPRLHTVDTVDEIRLMSLRGPLSGEPLADISMSELRSALPPIPDEISAHMPAWHTPGSSELYDVIAQDLTVGTVRGVDGIHRGPQLGRSMEWNSRESLWRCAGGREPDGDDYVGGWMTLHSSSVRGKHLRSGALPHHRVVPPAVPARLKACKHCGGDVVRRGHVKKEAREADGTPDRCEECEDELVAVTVLSGMLAPAQGARRKSEFKKERATLMKKARAVEPTRARITFEGDRLDTVAQRHGQKVRGAPWSGKRAKGTQINGTHGEFTGSDDVDDGVSKGGMDSGYTVVQMPAPSVLYVIGQDFVLQSGELLINIPEYDILQVTKDNLGLAEAVLRTLMAHVNHARRTHKDAGLKITGEMYKHVSKLLSEIQRIERLVREYQNYREDLVAKLPDVHPDPMAYAAAHGLSGGGGGSSIPSHSEVGSAAWLDELVGLIPADLSNNVVHTPPAAASTPTVLPNNPPPANVLAPAPLSPDDIRIAAYAAAMNVALDDDNYSEATTVVHDYVAADVIPANIAGNPQPGAVVGRTQEVMDVLATRPPYFCTPPVLGVRSLAAIFDSEHVYRQAGGGNYYTSGTSRSVVVLDRGHVPHAFGYTQAYPGYYTRDDAPDTVKTMDELQDWLDAREVALLPCATIEHYSGYKLLNIDGSVGFEIDGGSFVSVPMIMRAMTERFASPSMTANTFSSMVAWITRNYAGAQGFPLELLRGLVIGYFARIVGNVAASQHPLIRGAIQLSASQPRTGAHNTDASEAYLDAVAMSCSGQGTFTGYGHQLTTTHPRPVALPIGYAFDGAWIGTGEPLPIPEDTTRFTRTEVRGDAWRILPGSELQVIGRDLVPRGDLNASYHTRFMAILPVADTRIPIILNSKDPGEMAQGHNNRLMKAVNDEPRKIANTMNVVAYMLLLDPRIGGLVKRRIIRHCRHKKALCDMLRESVMIAERLLPFWQSTGPYGAARDEPAWDPETTVPSLEQMEALSQIAAASALIYRIERCERLALAEGATVDFVGISAGIAFVMVCGVMLSKIWLSPVGAIVSVMHVALGILCLACTYRAVQFVYARVDAKMLHMVDQSGFAYRYLNGGHDWWYNMQSFVMQPHPKSRLYRAIVAGFYISGIDWTKAEPAMVKGEVEIKGKPDEWCKYQKALRMIGACGGQIVFLVKFWTALKHWWSGTVDIPLSLKRASFFFDIRPAKHLVCYNRPTNMEQLISGEDTIAMTFSDDGCCIVKEDGEVEIVDDDRSNADNTMGFLHVGIIGATFEIVGLGHLAKAATADWVKPWIIRHPQDSASYVKYMPYHANMPSGTGGTTFGQNTQSVGCTAGAWACYSYRRWACNRAYAFAQSNRDDAIEVELDTGILTTGHMLRDAVLSTAVALGGQSTCTVSTRLQTLTFLKRTIMLDTQDDLVDCAVLGVVLRGFGVVPGDVTREMIGVSAAHWKTLDAAAVGERYMRGVLAGWCNEPRSAFWDAMRERFPPSNLLKNQRRDEEHKLEERLRGANNTNRYIPITQYIERYGGNEEEWISFCDAIRGIAPGVVLRHPVVDLILQVDYGVV